MFSNNCSAALASAIDVSTDTLTLANVVGAWPVPSNGDFFKFTLSDAAETKWEICTCSANASGVLSIQRAQEGTVARAWPAGSVVEIRETAGFFNELALKQYSQVLLGDSFATNQPFQLQNGIAQQVTSLSADPTVNGIILSSGHAGDTVLCAMTDGPVFETPLAFNFVGTAFLGQDGRLTAIIPSSEAGDVWSLQVARVLTSTTFAFQPDYAIQLA